MTADEKYRFQTNFSIASQKERTEKHIDRYDWDGTFRSSPLREHYDDYSADD
jgi:hypothetical protein